MALILIEFIAQLPVNVLDVTTVKRVVCLHHLVDAMVHHAVIMQVKNVVVVNRKAFAIHLYVDVIVVRVVQVHVVHRLNYVVV